MSSGPSVHALPFTASRAPVASAATRKTALASAAAATVPVVTRRTRCQARSRRVITFRSVTGPPHSVASTATSPANEKGADATVSATAGEPRGDRRRPAPATTVSVRSMPAKAENGPSASTLAMLMRQSKSASVAPSGPMATSAVSPWPFFQRMRR